MQRIAFGTIKLEPATFWSMTLKEFALTCEGHREFNKQYLFNFWVAGKLYHCDPKRYPSYDKLVGNVKPMSEDEVTDLQAEMVMMDKIKKKKA